MDTQHPAAQTLERKVKSATVEEIAKRIRDATDASGAPLFQAGMKIYGIPRGGACLAYMVASLLDVNLVLDPRAADLIIDDIVDSGKTAKHYRDKFPHTMVWAPYTKYSSPKIPGVLTGITLADRLWIKFPWERHDEDGPHDAVTRLLEWVGEDPSRDGLIDTPARVVKAWKEMTRGYQENPKEILAKTFDVRHDEMVHLTDIHFTSLCEHHVLPFVGTASVAYLPHKKVVGISKLARLVECYAARLQVQERMTEQVADAIMKYLQPLGCGVLIRAHHGCMSCRGVRQHNTNMVTTKLRGLMKDNDACRAEFLSVAGYGK